MSVSQPALSLPLLSRKEVAVDFDGGELSSDGGWLLLSLADRKLQLCARLAKVIDDPRAANHVDHPLEELIRQRVLQIAQGYADQNDSQVLRSDPLLKTAVGRAPGDPDLAGQSSMSRLENRVTAEDLVLLEY